VNELKTQERNTLINKLFTLLQSKPGQNKYNLKLMLGNEGLWNYTTSDINSVLYCNPKFFEKGFETLPTWKVNLSALQIPELTVSKTLDLVYYKGHQPRAWQSEAIQSWINAGRRGVVEAVTGTGKTTVGIIAAADAIARGLRVLILVPGTDLLEQWHEKLTKDLPNIQIGKLCTGYKDTLISHQLLVATVHSAKNSILLPEKVKMLIVADEVHRYGADKFSLALRSEYDERLGLTATYKRGDDGLEDILSPYFAPKNGNGSSGEEVIAGCGYARGLNDGILAPFRVGLLGVELEPDERELYATFDGDARNKRTKLINQYNCPAEPFGAFMNAVTKLNEGNHGDYAATNTARGYLNSFSKRKILLASSLKKTHALQLLVPLFGLTNQSLVFTETKESALNAATLISNNGIVARDFSSDLTKEERKDMMSAFGNGTIKVLSSPKVLDEGIDVPEADLGVILAASHNERQMIQRMGRIIRPKKDARPATFIIVYVRNTSEDPELGTHEAFLDQMYDHAEDVHPFPENVNAFDVCRWYLDKNI
jgi:RNA polymerase primary sigma factor